MILTSLVSLSKKKIRIKIVELENCYKGKKFTQSFQPLEMEVQEGLGRRDGRRKGQRGENAVTPGVVARETQAPGPSEACLCLSITNIYSLQMCAS